MPKATVNEDRKVSASEGKIRFARDACQIGPPPINSMQAQEPSNRLFRRLGALAFNRGHDGGPLCRREDVSHRLRYAERSLCRFYESIERCNQGLSYPMS